MKLQTMRTVPSEIRSCAVREIVLVMLSLHDPLEAARGCYRAVQRRLAAINAVQLATSLQTAVNRILQHVPFEAGVVFPFADLPELVSP